MEVFYQSPNSKGPIEFVIDQVSDVFLGLNNSFLKVKCKITKANGQNLAETDKFSVISYPLTSLFSQIDILLGRKVTSTSTSTYSYRAHVETFLQYSKETKNAQLGMALFYKNTAGHFDELYLTSDHAGLNKRYEFGKLSKTKIRRVHSDIFNKRKLLMNGLPTNGMPSIPFDETFT